MSFVNENNTKYRSGKKYAEVISKIKKEGICPFCGDYMHKFHKKPILKTGKYWLLTDNAYPYEGAKHQLLLVHKKHIESVEDLSAPAWAELRTLAKEIIKKRKIKGGSFLMRFGDTDYTGASVAHLHANLVSPDGEDPNRKPIITRIA